MKTKSSKFFIVACIILINLILVIYMSKINTFNKALALSKVGSSGTEVTKIQTALKDRGLFNTNVTGYYGTITEQAVRKFQQQQGLSVDGIVGPQTLRALGITVGNIPSSTESNINLLGKIISAEARGEPYIGQVAVGAVILNRVEHTSFPDSLAGVIYQPGAFTAITDGQFEQPISDSAYQAARDAINGWDPTGGCIYYYNPNRATSQWIFSRQTITTIGKHRFCT